jgi:GNAT superfamily N-acetyltransferase
MITFRAWDVRDWPWLVGAAAAAAWEMLSPEERESAQPEQVQKMAATQIQQTLGTGFGHAVVAERFGRPVGFALGAVAPDTSTGEPNGLLINVWVDPAVRRQGIARSLREIMEAMWRAKGVRKAKLWTTLANQPGVKLGEGAGYVREAIIHRKPLG